MDYVNIFMHRGYCFNLRIVVVLKLNSDTSSQHSKIHFLHLGFHLIPVVFMLEVSRFSGEIIKKKCHLAYAEFAFSMVIVDF